MIRALLLAFLFLASPAIAQEPTQPAGRLTLVQGKPVMPAQDVTSGTVWYAGGSVPILNASLTWNTYPLSADPLDTTGLAFTGGAKLAAGTQRDMWVTLDGVPALCAGPAWPATDFASRKLVARSGLYVNSDVFTCDTSASASISVGQYRATWVGSINIAAAGQLQAIFSYGQNRRIDVWNAYNQVDLLLSVGNPGPPNASAIWTPSNQYPNWLAWGGNVNNRAYVFTGKPTDVDSRYMQSGFIDSRGGPNAHFAVILWNGTISGTLGVVSSDATNVIGSFSIEAQHVARDQVGVNIVTMAGAGANTLSGITVYGGTTIPGRAVDGQSVMRVRYKG